MGELPASHAVERAAVRPNLRATPHSFEGVGGWNQGGVERPASLPEPRRTRTPARERRPRIMGGACVKAARMRARARGRRGWANRRPCRTVAEKARFPPSRRWSTRSTRRRRRPPLPGGRVQPQHPTGRFQSVEAWTRARAARSRTRRTPPPRRHPYRASGSRAAPAASAASASASACPPPPPPATTDRATRHPRARLTARGALPSPHDHVHVVVVSCAGLRGADFTSYSDPFVEVCALGASKKHRHRTSPVRQTLNPTWDTAESRFLVPCATDAHGDAFGASRSRCLIATSARRASSSAARR